MAGRQPSRHPKIYRGADGMYHAYVTVGEKDDGSPDRRHRMGKTRTEVAEKVSDLETKISRGQSPERGRIPTVEQWMTTYLDTIAVQKLAPRTYDDYWSKTRNWIIPGLGKHRLDRLKPDHLDKLYAAMQAAEKAPSHILKVHRILSRALAVALRREHVSRNVATMVDPPSASEVEITPLTEGEARHILTTAQKRPSSARWSLGLALGLRQGEALGLRWEYVDLKACRVRVWWQLQRTTWRHGCDDPHACGWRTDTKGRTRHRTTPCPKDCAQHTRKCPPPCKKDCKKHATACPKRVGGGLVFREPKGKSKRTVAIAPELASLLKTYRAAQHRERLTAGLVWEDHDLVFCRPDGRPIDPRDDWDDWKSLLAEARIRDARVHDGRHTAATILLEHGVDVRVVMEILGHSDLRVTTRYTHVASPLAEEAARRMGQALWGTK
ncbi:tyrosine-type recombinase/integrase [Cryptosporangium sp. NPDC051539]|uniref:tyrosine-type recombinase/integrase n=1 Tax=Cryptosporangium sp. NPDC051539 TaxID=3363962 RepID=UPI0037A104D3